jgi:hypothetical protein
MRSHGFDLLIVVAAIEGALEVVFAQDASGTTPWFVALATVSDARTAAAFSGAAGTIDALRGGTYVVSERSVRFVDARVVTDAVANGTQKIHARTARTHLRLRGHGIPRARLTLRSTETVTRVTGTVGGHHVRVQVPSTH